MLSINLCCKTAGGSIIQFKFRCIARYYNCLDAVHLRTYYTNLLMGCGDLFHILKNWRRLFASTVRLEISHFSPSLQIIGQSNCLGVSRNISYGQVSHVIILKITPHTYTKCWVGYVSRAWQSEKYVWITENLTVSEPQSFIWMTSVIFLRVVP